MSDTNRQLERVLLAQEKVLSVVGRHERRLERLHMEVSRAVTVIYRLKLASDFSKAGGQRREASLDELSRRLAAIEKALAVMSD